MSNAVRFTQKKAIQRFQAYALVLVAFSTAALAGCSGLVTANNGGGGTPPPLTISGVQAAAPTPSGFQVSWSTNVAANSAVDFGTTANYGSSTLTNSAMVTSHQVALSGLAAGTLPLPSPVDRREEFERFRPRHYIFDGGQYDSTDSFNYVASGQRYPFRRSHDIGQCDG